jgi:hypothetical protein
VIPAPANRAGAGIAGSRPARRRLALGLSPMRGSGLVLLPLGFALGPRGLNLLTEPVLGALDPAVSVALAALGVFVGLDVAVRHPREGRLLAASSVLAAITMAIVGGGVLLAQRLSGLGDPMLWIVALVAALAAAASSTAAGSAADAPDSGIARTGNLGDLLPIVVSVLALAWARQGSIAGTLWMVGESTLIAITIAIAAWLLVTQTSLDSEQRVFAFGALLLLGGTAAHLSLSALFTGLLAGLFWKAVGAPASDPIVRDMRYLQHPLLVLLLVVAGARLNASLDAAVLAAAYVVFRILGKLAGGWLMASTISHELPRDLGVHLIAPGAVGIAIALNVLHAHPTVAATHMALAVVVLGSLGSEVLSLVDSRRGPVE